MAGIKQGLPRGIYALIDDNAIKVPARKEDAGDGTSESAGTGLLYIDINDIKPNSDQPRQDFSQATIDELAASIEEYGVLQPLQLEKTEKGYELISGERRLRAARKAGLKEVPAFLQKVTKKEKALFAIIENVQREDLNMIEEAMAYQKMIQEYGFTQEVLAKAVGKSRPHIANTLRAFGMQEQIVDMLRKGALTLGHANALGAVKDADEQLLLARKAAKSGLSVRETERLAAKIEKKPVKKARQGAKTDEIRGVEQELTSATGVRVNITGDGRKGSVELRYFDRQGLEEIIELLRNARTGGK